MPDIEITYNNNTIVSMSDSGTEVLETNGKLCSDDITVAYTRTNGSATTPATTITANPTISVSNSGLITASVGKSQSVTPTVSAGYVSSGTAGTITVSGSKTSQLTTQAAQTIHPSTLDRTIASGTYLTGTQTVKGVLLTNLLAGNIKKNVVVKVGDSTDDDCVRSVTGTFEGGGVPNIQSLSVTQNGTYTASGDVDGYSPVTVNVSGGSSVEPKDVNFIDYDGTLLHSYTKTEFANLSDLPSNPSHTGLTAQGWNWTLAVAKTYVASYGKLWIGQMYITQSGDTEIDIELHAPRLSPYLGIAVNGTVEVDWGDGTAISTVTGTSLTTQVRTLHNYFAEGSYTIKIHKVSGSYAPYGSSTYSILSGNYSTPTGNRVYSNAIRNIHIGSSVTSIGVYAFSYCYSLASVTIPSSVTSIGAYAFQSCVSLASVTVPSGITSIGTYVFYVCNSLASIAIPSSVTSIGTYAFNSCYSLASMTIPSNVTSIGNNAFQYCYSLASVTIPSSVTSIGNNAFSNCYGLGSIHFKSSTPPSVGNSNAWTNLPTVCIIYVPTGSLSNYTGATNYPSSSTYTYVEE